MNFTSVFFALCPGKISKHLPLSDEVSLAQCSHSFREHYLEREALIQKLLCEDIRIGTIWRAFSEERSLIGTLKKYMHSSLALGSRGEVGRWIDAVGEKIPAECLSIGSLSCAQLGSLSNPPHRVVQEIVDLMIGFYPLTNDL